MKDARLTSARLTEWFLQRVETYDRGGPELNAGLEVTPRARATAEALARERASGGIRGPLHGIPVFLKDNIATADRLHTSAGSLALRDAIAPRDAFLVSRLREEGAVILGKVNMTEWANFMTTGMPAGYSSRGGQVKNPYGDGWSPGGSRQRLGRRRCRESVHGGGRHRDLGLDPEPGQSELGRWHQAHARSRLPLRSHPDRRKSGYRGAVRAHRGRRGASPRRDDGRRRS